MMSITSKSRILAVVLAIAMVLSLVPVMAAADGGAYSVDYVSVAYPESSDSYDYVISARITDAKGVVPAGEIEVSVRVEKDSDPLFFYDVCKVKDGVLKTTVTMLAGDATGEYLVEVDGAAIKTPAKVSFFFDTDIAKAKQALKDAASGKPFDDMYKQQIVTTSADAIIYNNYITNNKYSLSADYINNAHKLVSDAMGTTDIDFTLLETVTVEALFNALDVNTYTYMEKQLYSDSDIINVLKEVNSKFADASKTYTGEDFTDLQRLTVGNAIRKEIGFGKFDIKSIADSFVTAVAGLAEEDEDKKEESNKVTSSGSTGGGSTTPIGPVVKPHVTAVFTDLDQTAYWWMIEPLQALYSAGYINGRTATTFAPGENITRAEFLKILLMELDMVDANATASFDDVNTSDWFYTYVASGATQGVVQGKTETSFAPNDLITRQEICVMTMRAVRAKNVQLGNAGTASVFTDESLIAELSLIHI